METFDKNQYVENLLSSAMPAQQYTYHEVFDEIYSKLTPQQKIEALWDALAVMSQNPHMILIDCVFYAMGFDYDYTNSLGTRIYTKNREGIDY